MAAPGGIYFIQDKLTTPHAHHANFKALWETKWKTPCEMGVYPFMFGALHDFEPVATELIQKGMKEPYDWDAYAQTFFPYAERLVKDAELAGSREGNKEKASELYLRASALYRIARFPAPRSPKQKQAWEYGKEAARDGLALSSALTTEIPIPHTPLLPTDKTTLPAFHHLPPSATPSSPAPLVIIITGLDGYRTDLSVWIKPWSTLGVATLVVEIPGTGDNPATPGHPASTDAVWNSMFAWIDQQASIDPSRVTVWAFSTGGYFALRLAHTHAHRLAGVVAQGGGCHHMFDADWLDAAQTGEYPFDLGSTLAHAFGYGGADDFDAFKREARSRFSLVEDGTLDRGGCAPTLLINGTEDSIFPIDDLYVALQHGSPKEARVVRGTPHMGEPDAFSVILQWLAPRLGVAAQKMDTRRFMSWIPSRPKY